MVASCCTHFSKLQCDTALPDPSGGSLAADVASQAQALSEVEFTRTLRSIDVTPGDARIELNQKATLPIKAVARYNDRSTREVSAAASFSIDNTAVGSITAGTFESDRRSTSTIELCQGEITHEISTPGNDQAPSQSALSTMADLLPQVLIAVNSAKSRRCPDISHLHAAWSFAGSKPAVDVPPVSVSRRRTPGADFRLDLDGKTGTVCAGRLIGLPSCSGTAGPGW